MNQYHLLEVGRFSDDEEKIHRESEERTKKLKKESIDLKKSERLLAETGKNLEELLSVGPVIIYRCEPNDNFHSTFISENVKNQLGYAPCKFTGKSDFWVNHIHPDDAPHILKNLVDLVEKGRHTREYRFLHKDGTYRWMYDQLRVVYDSDGEATDVVGNWNHEPRRSGLFICPDTPATPSPTTALSKRMWT